MKHLQLGIEVSSDLYIKNPNSSTLGKNIITSSIELFYEIGYEEFTFKKLGVAIQSPESSIYRYFKNKHELLIYLTSWYWTWTEYRLVFATTNISSPKERLKICLELLTQPVVIDNSISYVNEMLLSEIIFAESLKAYHTRKVDVENEKGCFKAYKMVVQRVSDILLEIKPDFKQAHMLVTTVIEGAHQQKYFAEHLPALTDVTDDENMITNFYTNLVFNFFK